MFTKSGARFAMGPNDWRWFNKKVSKVVAGFHEQGYKIVIFRCAGGRLVKYRLYVYAAGPCVCVAHSRCLGGPLAPLPKRRAASAAAHTRAHAPAPR